MGDATGMEGGPWVTPLEWGGGGGLGDAIGMVRASWMMPFEWCVCWGGGGAG